MTDADLLALCVALEAGGEPDDGKAAVARVIYNRMRRHFLCDGTVAGTVLAYDQFSWAYFAYTPRVGYHRVASNRAQAQAVAERLLATVPAAVLQHCGSIAAQVAAGTYRGADYDRLTDDGVEYLNPASLPHLPPWASPDKLICIIGRHHFFRA